MLVIYLLNDVFVIFFADNVPPVTDTTRSALQARLAKLEKEAGNANMTDEGGDKGAKSKNSRRLNNPPQTSRQDETVATYVFLDLEATGLAISRPRITELSMVAAGREQFRELQSELRSQSDSEIGCRGDEQPRVLNKLTLCFYPGTQVPHQVTKLTGLDNFNLEDQKRFDGGAAELIRGFLNGLAKPVCLVAHNGLRYDYPLLLSEIVKAVGEEHSKSVISDEVLCLDSLPTMREIFAEEKEVATRLEVEEVSSLVAQGVMDDVHQDQEGDEDDFLDDFKPIRWYREEQTPVVTPTKSLSLETRAFPLPVTPPTSNSKKRPRMEAAPLPKPCFKNLAVSLHSENDVSILVNFAFSRPHFQANFNHLEGKAPSPPVIPQAVAAANDEPDEMRDENEVTPDKRIPNSGQPPPAPKRPSKSSKRFLLSAQNETVAQFRSLIRTSIPHNFDKFYLKFNFILQ